MYKFNTANSKVSVPKVDLIVFFFLRFDMFEIFGFFESMKFLDNFLNIEFFWNFDFFSKSWH